MTKKIIEIVLKNVNSLIKDKAKKWAGVDDLIKEIDKLKENKKIHAEINTNISQEQTQLLTNGVPFEDYKKERDLREKCNQELRQHKIISSAKIEFHEESFIENVKKDVVDEGKINERKLDFIRTLISGNTIDLDYIILTCSNTATQLKKYANKSKNKSTRNNSKGIKSISYDIEAEFIDKMMNSIEKVISTNKKTLE